MARLLVSVRSADEASVAASAGADIIDVKEPSKGPLGCADPSIWAEVRRVVPNKIPLSVALGELTDWLAESIQLPSSVEWGGVSFAKMGSAGSGSEWLSLWTKVRRRFEVDLPETCSWVMVIYADWLAAGGPEPDQILAAALDDTRCVGVLVDTCSKKPRRVFDPHDGWPDRVKQVQRSGRFFAWAGGVDIGEIERLSEAGVKPDIIAVRGSACRDGDRLGTIDEGRVARLREAAARV